MAVQVTFRTLTGATFKLSADPSDTVLDIKRKVADREHVSDYASYRLIFKGKILSDDATIASAGISSTGFVVVMPPKKRPPKPAATSTPAPAPTSAPTSAPASAPASASTPSPTPADAQSTPAPKPQTAPTQPQSASSSAPSGPSSLVVGQEYEQTVRRICEMGFPESDVKNALRAAFNNPDRAVDYLFNGIPEDAMPSAPPTNPNPATTTEPTPNQPSTTTPSNQPNSTRSAATGTPFNMFEAAANAAGADGATGTGSLDFLRSVPQFNLMRRLIQSNPAVLPQLLQQLENINPSLMALIEDNQAEFTRLINEPIPEGEEGGDAAMAQLAQAMANSGGGGDGPAPGQILVTEQEREQLNRLNELAAGFGLEQAQVVETWLACDRNENLAANYLVENAEQLRADQAANESDNAADEQDNGEQNPSDQPDQGNQGPPA